jgi:hypothetical protein
MAYDERSRQLIPGEGTVRKLLTLFGLSTVVIALVATALPAEATGTTQCTSALAPGTYQRVVVPVGAVCLSEGPVTIRDGLWIQSGATFVLGSEESGWTTGTIGGGVHAWDAASVQIHFATINGGIRAHGGSGPFGGPFEVTFNAIEDNVIRGGVTVTGYDGFWFGFIRNDVRGTVRLSNNVLADPDGNEYVTNVIHGSLMCSGNSPAPQVGDSEGLPNDVTGAKTGQCTAV